MNLKEICRTCLRSEGAPCFLFGAKLTKYELKQGDIIDLLNSFTEISINNGDEFPQQICLDCLDEIERLYSFKLKCEKSDVILKQLKVMESYDKHQSEPSQSDLLNTANEEFELLDHKLNVKLEMEEEWEISSEQSIECPQPEVKNEPELTISSYMECREKLNRTEENDPSAEIFECRCCSYTCSNLEGLKNHLIENHTEGQKCKICLKEFECSPSEHCFEHLAEREKPIKDSIQSSHDENETIEKRTRLQNYHRKGKRSKGDFHCKLCPKSFPFKYYLKVHHAQSHSKFFKCEICLSTYQFKINLTHHMRTTHPNKETAQAEKKSDSECFQCESCSKSFARKWILERHVRTHDDNVPVTCEICSIKYSRADVLRSHMRKKHRIMFEKRDQLNNKLIQCEFCSKIFATNYSLNRHAARFVDKCTFNCEICSKKFRGQCSLKRHMKSNHANEIATDIL